MIGSRQRFGMIAAVSLRVLYLIFQQVLGLISQDGSAAKRLADLIIHN